MSVEPSPRWMVDPELMKCVRDLLQAQNELDVRSAALTQAEIEHSEALERWRTASQAFNAVLNAGQGSAGGLAYLLMEAAASHWLPGVGLPGMAPGAPRPWQPIPA